MSIGNMGNPFGSGGGTSWVDHFIGRVYPTVKLVADNLDQLVYIVDHMNEFKPHEIEFQFNSDTKYLQWRYVGTEDWFNLAYLSDMTSEQLIEAVIPQIMEQVDEKIETLTESTTLLANSLGNLNTGLSLVPEALWSSVSSVENDKPGATDALNVQAQELANRTELLRDNQKRTALQFVTFAEAEVAAATLPDGQVVEAPDTGGIVYRYDVLDGVLLNQRPVFDTSEVLTSASATATAIVDAAISSHNSAEDPHTQYVTSAELSSAVSSAVPITAKGDLIVGGDGGVPVRLPNGTDGEVLKMVSGVPAWGDAGPGGSSDAASVTYTPSGTGAATTNVQDKLREAVSIKDFGGVGDGVASDQNAVANAIASGFESLLVNDDAKFLVASLDNNMGVELGGHGHIVKAITGGLRKLNSYADKNKYIFGTEYLAAFHNLLISQSATPTRKPVMVFSGDSTTAGTGVSSDYQIHALMKNAGEVAGLQTIYGLSSINRGQSGKNTAQWVRDYLAGDLAANPDLLVLRWGINDPGYYSANPDTGPAQDAGQAAAGRRTPADFIASLRSGLATIRASRSVSSLSIVLMTPNSTSDTPNARDELWYEQITPGIKQAARDFKCAFVDTYGYLRDSRPAAGVWMDNPFSDGRAIHPANVMNVWIAGLMASVVFPDGLRHKIGLSNVTSKSGAEDVGDVTRLPSYYRKGITIGRAYATSTAWPLDGSVLTIKSADDSALQINYPYRTSERTQLYFRMGGGAAAGGGGDSWGSWIASGGAPATTQANVTPSSGYTTPATGQARAVKSGNQVICEGYITKSSPSVLAAGTVVGTLPAGFRPISEAAYWNAVVWDGGGGFAYVVARASPSGTIDVATATSISVARIWLNVNFSTLA